MWNRTRATGRLPPPAPSGSRVLRPRPRRWGATPTAPPRRLRTPALAALPLAQAGAPQCRERPQQAQGGGRRPRGRPGFRKAPDLRGTRTVDPGGGRARPACGLPAAGSQEAPDLPSRPAAGGDRRSPVCVRSSLAMAPCPTAPCPTATSSRPLGAARAPAPLRPFASASRRWTGAAPAGRHPVPDRARASEEISGSRTTPPRGEAGFPGPTPARRAPPRPSWPRPLGSTSPPAPPVSPRLGSQARSPVRCPRPVRCSARPPSRRNPAWAEPHPLPRRARSRQPPAIPPNVESPNFQALGRLCG